MSAGLHFGKGEGGISYRLCFSTVSLKQFLAATTTVGLKISLRNSRGGEKEVRGIGITCQKYLLLSSVVASGE